MNADLSLASQHLFESQIIDITKQVSGKKLSDELGAWLNENFGAHTPAYQALKASCINGVSEGWLCNREAGGLRYGRIFKPSESLHGFSVDVVDMKDIAGPHHAHPLGEIDLIMPLEGEALFDGHGAGWMVYPERSAHSPTVTNGRALVLYLLPEGKIEFTK
jgi:hypothetical protein